MLFNPVRADIIPEVMAFLHHIPRIEMEIGFLSLTVEVMENPQPFRSVQLHAFGTESCKVGCQIGAHTGKVSSRVLDVLFPHRDGDIFLLHNAVGTGRLIQQHLVILPAVHIPAVTAQGHENRLLKISPVQAAVVNGDLGGGPGVQTVQQLRIVQEHDLFVLQTGYLVVDVRKLIAFGELASNLKNTVAPHTPDGDHILHLAGNFVFLLILL